MSSDSSGGLVELGQDLLAISAAPGCTPPAPVHPFGGPATAVSLGSLDVWTTAAAPPTAPVARPDGVRVLGLSLGIRDHDFAAIEPGRLAEALFDGAGLHRVAAPFAAAAYRQGELVLATDLIGLRHVYRVQGDGWAAVSTSAVELARLAGADLDPTSVGTFAITGFHLGDVTPFRGVHKLPAGSRWRLAGGSLTTERYPVAATSSETEPTGSVREMANQLRSYLERCLDEYPETVFELSGGFDSRLLFAAVPPERRKGLRTLTLSAPGWPDAPIAAILADRHGSRHQVVDLTGLARLTPAEAHGLVDVAARRHDLVGNPVALGVLDWVEGHVESGTRVTGMGGEMCRGSYHMGQRQHPRPTTELVDRLARWWFVTNDAVDAEALAPEFLAAGRASATEAFRTAFAGYDTDWLTSIDEFFLRERIHRWVGINFTGAALRRTIVVPYLDPRFLSIAMAVPPRARSGSGFAARVMETLDPDLAHERLASGVRPEHLPRRYVPRALAEYSVKKYVRRGTQKVLQKARKSSDTAAGTPTLASLVVRHWRDHPELVTPVLRTGYVREEWLAGLLAGAHGANPSTVSFLTNLAAVG